MSILNLLSGQVQQQAVAGIGERLGLDSKQSEAAVAAAMPLLIKAMARNASDGGAEDLAGALERDHDGSILDDLPGLLTGGKTAAGAGILKHVLGGKQAVVASGIARAAGLDSSQSSEVMKMIAPVVLGALAKEKAENGLGAGDLIELLNGDTARLEKQNPDVMGILGNLLDADDDGEIADDLVRIGGKLLGGLF